MIWVVLDVPEPIIFLRPFFYMYYKKCSPVCAAFWVCNGENKTKTKSNIILGGIGHLLYLLGAPLLKIHLKVAQRRL